MAHPTGPRRRGPPPAPWLLLLALAACAGPGPAPGGSGGAGPPGDELPPCPDTPNCVSSRADPADRRHRIEPLDVAGFGGPPAELMARAAAAVERLPGARVTARGDGWLRAEARTRVFRFVDDLELRHDPDAGVLHLRSAARLGRWDFGVNRRRAERLRRLVREALGL